MCAKPSVNVQTGGEPAEVRWVGGDQEKSCERAGGLQQRRRWWRRRWWWWCGCVGMVELHKSGRGGQQLGSRANDDCTTQLLPSDRFLTHTHIEHILDADTSLGSLLFLNLSTWTPSFSAPGSTTVSFFTGISPDVGFFFYYRPTVRRTYTLTDMLTQMQEA